MISEAYGMAPSPGGSGESPNAFQTLVVPLLVVVGVFYFLIIGPQRKQEQKRKKFLSELKKGDEVMTDSGIFGKVSGIADRAVTLEIADKVRIKVRKDKISEVVPAESAGTAAG